MKKNNFQKTIAENNPSSSRLAFLQKKTKGKVYLKKIIGAFAIILFIGLAAGGYFLYQTNSTFDRVTGQQNSLLKSFIKMLPFGNNFFQVLPVEGDEGTINKMKNNKLDRLNVLLLGIRGAGDPNGGLLTDTMMVVSIKPQTNEVAMISIPRDLYVPMPNHDYKRKINEAYVLGMEDASWKNDSWKKGLDYSKQAVSEVTGLKIHYAVSVDFKAFKETVDTLGGVTITLDKPFAEKSQFEEGPISLPAGTQTIDGDTALLFSRARFSSSDFDRSKRQQQVLLAIKEKALGLGILSNPMKVMSIMNSIGTHVRTDAELWEIQELAVMAKRMDVANAKRKVFDTESGMLYSSRDSVGAYILLPQGGNFDKIQEETRDIFN